MYRMQCTLLWGTLVLLLAHPSFGGSLADRAKEVAERSEAKKPGSSGSSNNSGRRQDAANSAFGSGTYPSESGGSGFLSSFWGWLVTAPFQYRHEESTASGNGTGSRRFFFPEHRLGQATVPYARVDWNYQWADNIEAHDGRIELGYKLIAFHGRMTRYEDEVGDILDLRQYYAVFRYGGFRPDFIPGTFEFGVGLGGVHHTGSALSAAGLDNDSSPAFTIPLKYHPLEWFGVEFRPAWYRWYEVTIGDYDLSASLGARFVQFHAGYRWLWDNGVVDVQSGPYAGLSVAF